MAKDKEEKQETPTLLVSEQLPSEMYNTFERDGKKYIVLTRDEALAEILGIVRELKEGLL